ncbi:hypothetical protein NUW54_g3141 [Trametes sanguinea]|uniref:Uncharacterized protein n=1 Tax=Trametes sanguinea TaxID=158606 RepID=A0ACC1Q1U3_9APHY|nr:hypothetical protein NUW54_g3141 [Trametes sanguinea]
MTRASTNSTVLAVCSKSPVKCLSNDSALTRSLHTALMVYDWLISLDQEIATIWSKPRTGASVLYLFNRYSLLVSYVLNISTIGRMSTQAHLLSVDPNLKLCRSAMDQHWFGILVSAQSCRVYALTGQNKALSGLTLALGMMPFIVNVASRQLLYGLIHQAYTSTGNCIPDPHRKYGLAWLFQCVQPTRNYCIPLLDCRFHTVLLDCINSRGAEKYVSRYDQQEGNVPFLPATAVFQPSIVHAGVTISTSQDWPGNSFVLFRKGEGDTSGTGAGQGQQIFHHTCLQDGVSIQETYLVIKEFKPLS